MLNLRIAPFFLNEKEEKRVMDRLSSMTEKEKIGQILCPCLPSFDEKTIEYYTKELTVGAVMIRPFLQNGLKENIIKLQSSSKIPLLVAANLENGGNGAVSEGTFFANPLGVAATNDEKNAYRLGKISCAEASSVGINWAFAPIADIDVNYHNPITNVRTFGDKPERVLAFTRAYIRGANEESVIPAVKHFPGDGVDERDQHLLVSVNSLLAKQWFESFGKNYEALIADGVPAIMAGHISAPFVAKEICPDANEYEANLPASQSKILLTKLLREKLGFNGLIVTDSTLMVGYMQKMPRKLALPLTIEAGADMILFNRSIEEDRRYLTEGLETGVLSRNRLDEAVTRILALKESRKIGIDRNEKDDKKIVGNATFKAWTKECADRSVTLVKDDKNVLPLSPLKYKRIYLNVIENATDNNSPLAKELKKRLQKEGFKVTLRKRKYSFDTSRLTLENFTPAVEKAVAEAMCSTEEFTSEYDMAMIILDMKTASNATVVRVNWNVLFGMGNDLPWYAGEMPLVCVSLCNPYHLLDIPMANVYVNAYSDNEETIAATMEKLTGRSRFKGISPIDPFCGKIDTKL